MVEETKLIEDIDAMLWRRATQAAGDDAVFYSTLNREYAKQREAFIAALARMMDVGK